MHKNKTAYILIKNILKPAKIFLNNISVNLALWHHQKQMQHKIYANTRDYQVYLTRQLRRTLSKRKSPLRKRTKILVDKLSEFVDLSECDVLCIGPRNTMEIDYIRSKGAKSVIGIDLYSEHKDIRIMDMHNMTFANNSFDVVYSSHSLEHSYDLQQAVNEIIRVARPHAYIAIEMPVQFKPQGVDLVNIGNIQALYASFEEHVSQTLWVEEQQPNTPRNNGGTAIVRVILALGKKAENH